MVVLLGARDARPVGALLEGPVVFEPTVLNLAREAGVAGGPIDVRAATAPGRVLGALIEGGREAGVPVREVPADEVPAETSCFVGDLVGD